MVHFALNQKSIQILIEKGVMNLFESFHSNNGARESHTDSSSPENHQNLIIQTNISWIFLALCNNGIQGKEMLQQGITRDMFLVACNPHYQQIRLIVITGFAELGRCTDTLTDQGDSPNIRIKEMAISSMYQHYQTETANVIDTLLKFAASEEVRYQQAAFRSLKDYILLNYEALDENRITAITQALIVGSISENIQIQNECGKAISFLITHRLVYKCYQFEEAYNQKLKEKLMTQTSSGQQSPTPQVADSSFVANDQSNIE